VEWTIDRAHEAMRRGELTAEALVSTYLARIEDLDQRTGLNAIRVVNAGALESAREFDREFRTTDRLRALHGIPIIVKDNMDTKGLATTAGSWAMRKAQPKNDAYIVARLRVAGAIVLAKSNMAEWAISPLKTVGSMFGVTRNPYDLDRTPGGSSGGTASAIAANFGIIGLGTDTGNSVRGPSAHTGLVGFRPSLGLVGRAGIVPLFLNYDTAGPMCRTVTDAAKVMDVIVGHDPNDPITSHALDLPPRSFTASLDADALKGIRIGAFRTLMEREESDPAIYQLMETALTDLAAAGATIVDFRIPDIWKIQDELWCNTFRHDANVYLSSLGAGAPMADVAEVLKDPVFYSPYIEEWLEEALAIEESPETRTPPCLGVDEDDRREAFRDLVVGHMDELALDMMVYPTWRYPPRKVSDNDTPDGNNSYQIAPHVGFPAISVPMGYTDAGLPVGIQFLGRRFSDSQLLGYAYAYEQRTHHRRAPDFPTSCSAHRDTAPFGHRGGHQVREAR